MDKFKPVFNALSGSGFNIPVKVHADLSQRVTDPSSHLLPLTQR